MSERGAPPGAAPAAEGHAAVDLRSDTVTRPTAAMREAMARADVGDDVFGEDPTVNALQEEVAHLLGKEAALFVPSGTMANQLALRVHTTPGDDVLVGEGAHTLVYESGAAGAICGVQLREVGTGGLFSAEEVAEEIQPDDHHHAPTRLVCVENTHNRSGGRLFPLAQVERIAALARDRGLGLHLDGARLWNAAAAAGQPPAALAAPFDTVAVCLSKGLGAPAGSLLCGSRALVRRAHRYRKMLGGGMRQAGVLAAAGRYALAHHLARLVEDHANARALAAGLATLRGARVDVGAVETNIVLLELAGEGGDAAAFVAAAGRAGLRCFATGPRQVRLVTHLDVDLAGCQRAVAIARAILDGAAPR